MKLNQQMELLEKVYEKHSAIKIRSEKIIQSAVTARTSLASVRHYLNEFDIEYEKLMALLAELKEEKEMK